MTPAYHLLLWTLSVRRPGSAPLAGIDWEEFVNLAEYHGVRPLVYRALREACWDAVPDAVRAPLAAFYRANAIWSLRVTAELIALLDRLEREGIRAMPLKGPVLADMVYGDAALREYGDLDVLVPEADARRARAVAEEMGYHLEYPPGPGGEEGFVRNEAHYHLRNEQKQTVLEIHWRFAARRLLFPMRAETFWEHSQTVRFAGREVTIPERSVLLLFLAAHGAKHGWSALKWLCDVAWLADGGDWQWAKGRTGRLAIELAADLAPAIPPEARHAAASDRKVQALAESARTCLAQCREMDAFEAWWFRWRVSEGFWEALRSTILYLTVPTGAEKELLPAPRKLPFLYVLLRPTYLLWAYGGAAWRYLKRR